MWLQRPQNSERKQVTNIIAKRKVGFIVLSLLNLEPFQEENCL